MDNTTERFSGDIGIHWVMRNCGGTIVSKEVGMAIYSE